MMRREILATAIVATVALSACGDEAEQPSPSPEAKIQTSPDTDASTSPTTPDDAASARQLRITFGDTELTARLDDNAIARDLAAQLPLTLTFSDHNGVEKTAPLPNELSTDGAPDAYDPV